MSIMATYREKIESLLRARGMRQGDLAHAIGVHQSRISKWVNGEGDPDPSQTLKIARALGVPMEYLADETLDEPPAEKPDLPEWKRLILQAADVLGEEEATRRMMLAVEAETRRLHAEVERLKKEFEATTRYNQDLEDIARRLRVLAGDAGFPGLPKEKWPYTWKVRRLFPDEDPGNSPDYQPVGGGYYNVRAVDLSRVNPNAKSTDEILIAPNAIDFGPPSFVKLPPQERIDVPRGSDMRGVAIFGDEIDETAEDMRRERERLRGNRPQPKQKPPGPEKGGGSDPGRKGKGESKA